MGTKVRSRSLQSLIVLIFVLVILSTAVTQAGFAGSGRPPWEARPDLTPKAAPRLVGKTEESIPSHPHLPNESQHIDANDLTAVIVQALIGAVIGVTVFAILIPIYNGFFRRVAWHYRRETPSAQQVVCPGDYTGADNSCTLVVPRKRISPPLLHIVRSRESYFLKAERVDPRSGLTSGWLACRTHGNDAGEWSMAPVDGSPNLRSLTVKVNGQPPIETTLIRNS